MSLRKFQFLDIINIIVLQSFVSAVLPLPAEMTSPSNGMIFSSLIATGFLWGITNPFLKIGAQGIERIDDSSKTRKSLKELYFFLTNWKFILPYLVNQCGSLLFVITLQSAELTLANPIANSLSILFTFVGGWLLGEEVPDKRTFVGMLLVVGGISCYVIDKAQQVAT